jgi:hypothetical protein
LELKHPRRGSWRFGQAPASLDRGLRGATGPWGGCFFGFPSAAISPNLTRVTRFSVPRLRVYATVALFPFAAWSVACSQSQPAAPPPSTVYAQPNQQQYPQQQYPQQQYPQQQYPQQQYPQQQYPQQQYPQQQQPYPAPAPNVPQQPPAPQPPPLVPVAPDAVANGSIVGLRQIAQEVITALVAALPADRQSTVAGIPLIVDDRVGEVNAFAMCKQGRSAMAVTDGLLQILAYLAQSQAHDELMGSRKVDEYIRYCAARLTPDKPIPVPPAGFFNAASDGRVIARQRQVFEEEVAFVLGHELGHHYLGHLGCTASANPLGDFARVASDVVPLFNQPNEVAADLAGTHNVLDAGKSRGAQGGYAWTENGGLLSMKFFAEFGRLTPGDILLAFERSHPPSELRGPLIQQAALDWRSTGGHPFRIPGL